MNAMVIIANNLTFLNYLMDNIDKDVYKDVYFLLFNDTRIKDLTKQLNDIMKKQKIKYRIFTDKQVANRFIECMQIKDSKTCQLILDYGLSLKFLAIWYVFRFNNKINKAVLSDDDCIYKKEFIKIFNEDKFISQKCFFGSFSISEYCKMILDCFDYDVEEELFKAYLMKNKINSGMVFFTKEHFDLNKYERSLVKLFRNEKFYQRWYNPRRRTVFIGSLDEVFLTAFFFNDENFMFDDSGLNYNYQLFYSTGKITDKQIINNFNKKASIHVCVGKNKYKMYNKLIELGLIEGETNNINISKKEDLYV